MSQIPPSLPPSLPEIPPLPPLASLAYDRGMIARVGRPGIITAIGVISIVVAGLGFIGSLYSGLSLFGFSMMANIAGMMPPVPPPAPMVVATPVSATQPSELLESTLPVSAKGLDAAARNEVAAGLANLRFLSAPRLDQLNALLAEAGQDIFPAGDEPLTALRVQDELVQSHVTGLSADPSMPGPDTIRTDGGRFELYDDRAVFYPNRGEVVRISTLTTSTAGLTPAQVETIVQQAQATSGNAMNPAQMAALRTLLGTPGQQYVSAIAIPTAIRSAQAMSDGTMLLTFPNGFASIGPQGQMTSSSSGGGAAAFPFGNSRIKINRTAMALASFSTLLGFGLAIYLLVIGILTLRGSPRGRSLHLIYAWLKIPVTILGAVAAWWLTTSFMEALMAGNSGNPMFQQGIFAGVGLQHAVMGAIALIYPVALLIALQTKAVKDYYSSAA
jgi:hypothetical protein